MTHKHKEVHHPEKSLTKTPIVSGGDKKPKLELVLKADSDGSIEALEKSITSLSPASVDLDIIHRGIGNINKSDVLMAKSGSRLIIGFQIDLLPGIDSLLRTHHVEVRLYNVIYSVTADVEAIAETIEAQDSGEQTIGSARIIALFKSTRKGIIIGCKVQEGHLAVGQHFRIISAAAPVYSGRIESMHIGETAIQKADQGQQVGIKIRDFKGARIGDLVESYRLLKTPPAWNPIGEVFRNY